MSASKKITVFEVLVYVAYAFFILIGLAWFITSFAGSGRFNPQAFMLVAIFGIQAYFRHRLTNLIMGIISLFLSIFMLLQVMDTFNVLAKQTVLDGYGKALLTFCFVSIFMSGILIFSYAKLSFKDQLG